MPRQGFVSIYALIAIAVLVAAGAGFYASKPNLSPRGGGVVCTQEAKICPDGSAVSRTGPSCEFAACPGVSAAPSAGGSLLSSLRAVGGARETRIGNSEVGWYLAPGPACDSARQSMKPATEFYFTVDRGDPYTPPDECSTNRANVETSILGRFSRYGWSEIQCDVEPPPIIRIFKRGEVFAYLDLHKGCAGGAEDSADISLAVQGD